MYLNQLIGLILKKKRIFKMDLLDTITIKNQLEILILSTDKKGLKGKRKENYETLLEVLKTLNSFMLHFENLGQELKQQRNVNNSMFLENGRLKNKINYLTKEIEDLRNELKQQF